MISLFVFWYFAIDIALLFGLWRLIADGHNDIVDQVTALMLIFFWPAAIAGIGFYLLHAGLRKKGDEMKVGMYEIYCKCKGWI